LKVRRPEWLVFQLRKVRSAMRSDPGQSNRWLTFATPVSRAAAAVTVLNVEPGG
jgi:hypothetical protein